MVGFGALKAGRRLTERMNILQSGESIEDGLELFTESLLGVFDLSGVEACGQRRILISSARIFLICRFGSKLVHPAQILKNPRHTANTTDVEPSTDLGRKLSLSATEDDVQEFLARGHRSDLIKR